MPSRISQMRNEQLPQQTLPQQSPQINDEYIQQLKTLMNSKNAQQFLLEMAQMNPQFRNIMEVVQKGNGQQLFEMLAKQRNIDPNIILQKLTK